MRIKKKIFAAVLSVALACSSLSIQEMGMTEVFAEEEASSDFTIDENGVLTEYNGAGGDVVIPEGVTSIGDYAFYDCSRLTGITIPDSVTSIAKNAFRNSGLTKIKGKKGSYAESYAEENGYEFVVIDNDTPGDVTGPSDDVSGDAATLAGDADCSGTVNLEDATIVLRIAVGIKSKNPISEQGQKNADFDKSGKVDLKDATYTLKTAVGIKFTLPEI